MKKNKALVFDMDGTIADLYGVNGWLADLRSESIRPYAMAKPLYDMVKLNTVLDLLKGFGYTIIVTSWLANNSTDEYKKNVARVKREWLEEYEFPADIINIVDYGTPKQNVTRSANYTEQILFDDNAEIRNDWDLGRTVDASADIMEFLIDLASREIMNV